jgi:hypothetical protein
MTMELKPGTRLRSSVSTVEVVVVRAPAVDVDVRCGGVPMVPQGGAPADAAGIAEGFAGTTAIGKRYSAPESAGLPAALEVMVTKAGDGLLSIGDALLEAKDAKPLPASD